MKLEPMRVAGIGGMLFLAIVAGCGGVKPAPPAQSPTQSATQSPTQLPSEPAKSAPQAAVEPAAPPSAAPAQPTPPSPAAATQAATEPAQRPPSPPAPSETVAKAAPPAAKAAPKAPSAPAPAAAAQPPKPAAAPSETAKAQAAPPLDLNSLETRLKETKAIGVMTKLSLKNQVDDLLSQFRAFYAGKLKTTLADLRRPFDLLILKVLSLLQDSDPSLASAIASSREAIWGILSDPVKFANFAST